LPSRWENELTVNIGDFYARTGKRCAVVIRIGEIIDQVRKYHPGTDVNLIEKAYIFSAMAHQGQLRQSGEPYLSHPLEVTGILARMQMDAPTVAAGLLHDAPEDTGTPMSEIEERFGAEVASLVEGVTKLGKMAFSTSEEREAENFRKMILAMSRDVRVILIKLADRLHNARTLEALPEAKRRRIARETMDIYAPLANRLGIAWIKWELEDLAFRHLDPEAYEDIRLRVAKKRVEREKYIEEVRQLVTEKLEEAGIKAEVVGRAKHFFSIRTKMERQNIPFNEVHDLIALRLIAPTVQDCYAVLGTLHAAWMPVPGRFKDYIALPKANRYQSLHTTVIGPGGERVEFQIRTPKMHTIAEQGIAAHWKYKEGVVGKTPFDRSQSWLRDLLEWQKDLKDPKEFMESVKGDLFTNEVYCFTPQGDVKSFPFGATPVDFAYSVHTDVGHTCAGAKVNGRLVPLRYKMKNGDTLEILTLPGHKPSKDWLKFVKTPRARTKIKAWIKLEQRTRSVVLGRELLEKELRRHRKDPSKVLKAGGFDAILPSLGLKSVEEVWANVGYGKLTPRKVVNRLFPEAVSPEKEEIRKESKIRELVKKITRHREEEGVKIGGEGGMLVRFAQCCNPVPGDEIIGFITRGRGVSVHTADCPNIDQILLDPERQIDVQWDLGSEQSYPVKVMIESLDRPGILAAISSSIADGGVNITGYQVTTKEGMGHHELELEIRDLKQLRRVLKRIEQVKGVRGAKRLRSPLEKSRVAGSGRRRA
jgi:guanosine-3',5'-bis(diphosphate) 3'-pyrophosphohydrolase